MGRVAKMAEVRPYREFPFLIAFKATSMESRSEATRWLKARGAVHVLADVWFLKAQYLFAEDISHEFERSGLFHGKLFVVKLHQASDWSRRALSEEADSWISKNLAS